mmetsp:Transcript_95868/g.206954  ORF Transcript_95868/g.206954 Transcript_95868/m.206954 type:complete len:108 (+) Transcript_95868:1189-1512(+)
MLGAYSVKFNGCIQNKIGSSVIAKVAKYYQKNVFVVSESTKFDDRSLLESFCKNDVREAKNAMEFARFSENKRFFNSKHLNINLCVRDAGNKDIKDIDGGNKRGNNS